MVCRDDAMSPDRCLNTDPGIGELTCMKDTDCQVMGTGYVTGANDRCEQTTHKCVSTACAKNIVIGENCRNGNSDGPVDTTKCAVLQPAGLYRVAVNDYIANGGSGFTVLKRNASKQDSGISLRDSLTVYLSKQDKCSADQVDETDMPQMRKVVDLYGNISCLDTVEQHDGRIRPVFQ
jgi:hypothetical protein